MVRMISLACSAFTWKSICGRFVFIDDFDFMVVSSTKFVMIFLCCIKQTKSNDVLISQTPVLIHLCVIPPSLLGILGGSRDMLVSVVEWSSFQSLDCFFIHFFGLGL